MFGQDVYSAFIAVGLHRSVFICRRKITGYLKQSQDAEAWVFASAIPFKTIENLGNLLMCSGAC